MSSSQEEPARENILNLLATHGVPDKGHFHVTREGGELEEKNVLFDPEMLAASTAVMVLAKDGGERCYDAQGNQVFVW